MTLLRLLFLVGVICPLKQEHYTTSSPPFFLRDSRASETRAGVKIIPREKMRHAACRLFSRGVIFTRARVSLALLSPRKNGGLLVVYKNIHCG